MVEPREPSIAETATRGSAVRLLTELAGRSLAFAATVVIARGLGPESYGTFAVLVGVALVAAELADLGLAGTAARALADRSWRLRDLVRAKLALTAAVLVLALLAAVASAGRGPLLALAVLVVGVATSSWVDALGIALRCAGRALAEASVLLLARASLLASVAAAALLGSRLEGYAVALAASPLLALAVAATLAARADPQAGAGPPQPLTAVLREALPVGLATALSLVAFRVELWLLLPLRGPVDTGVYGGALRAFDGLKLIPAALTQGAMPFLAREASQAEGAARARTLRSIVLVAVPVALSLFALAPQAVVLLLGPAFARAAGPTRLLAVALLPAFVNTFLMQALLAVGRAREMPRLMALRLLASFGLGLLLMPALGAPGAALACGIAEAVVLLRALHVARDLGLRAPVVAAVRDGLHAALPLAAALALFPAVVALGVGLPAYVALLWRGDRLWT